MELTKQQNYVVLSYHAGTLLVKLLCLHCNGQDNTKNKNTDISYIDALHKNNTHARTHTHTHTHKAKQLQSKPLVIASVVTPRADWGKGVGGLVPHPLQKVFIVLLIELS